MAMFPDSGVPPGEAKNSLPDVDTQGCDELWYSTSRCQPRFDPAAANAMLAEQMNLIMKGEVKYNCVNLNNVELSVRYLIQRGLPNAAILADGPNAYTTTIDPPLTRYNDHLHLIVVPNVACLEGVTLNVNGRGPVPVLRNDKLPLEDNDWMPGIPYIIAYWSGNFYMLSMVASQLYIPEPAVQVVDLWIRTDGNDANTGASNTPAEAFRTIQGAWNTAIGRFANFPLSTLNFKIGIPGTYAGAWMGPHGGVVTLTGDRNNMGGYRILTDQSMTQPAALAAASLGVALFRGLTFVMDSAARVSFGFRAINSSVAFDNCMIEAAVGNIAFGALLSIEQNATVGLQIGNLNFDAKGLPLNTFVYMSNGTMTGGYSGSMAEQYIFTNGSFLTAGGAALVLRGLSYATFGTCVVNHANNIGPQYSVIENSVLNRAGRSMPGSTAGSVNYGGVVI